MKENLKVFLGILKSNYLSIQVSYVALKKVIRFLDGKLNIIISSSLFKRLFIRETVETIRDLERKTSKI